MNNVLITGRLTAAPETKYTKTGKCVVDFTLAVDRGWGENKKTSFINCQVWEKRAEVLANSGIDKGHRLLVEGEWAQQSWETTDGQKRRKDFVNISNFEFLEGKKKDSMPVIPGQESVMDGFGQNSEPIPF